MAIGCSIAVIGSGIAAYIWKFHNLPVSNDQAIWGQLGDYLNMFVSAASLIFISVLTYVIHDAETRREEEYKLDEIKRSELKKREEEDRDTARNEDERARDRPILVFILSKHENGEYFWRIKNISKNVALNPVIAIDYGNGNWTYPVKIYSLGANEDLTLHWFMGVNRICAVYYDVKENVLTSIMQNDRMKISLSENVLSNLSESSYIRWEAATFQG